VHTVAVGLIRVIKCVTSVLAVAGWMLLGYAHAQPANHAQTTDDSLRLYAVNIVQEPPQPWTGYGIYLGKGLVITAAHVVGHASQTKPSVRIADMTLPATAIRESPYETLDLTLLSIDEQKLPIYLRMRRMPLCEKAPVGRRAGDRRDS
jgi:hypothetical protein